MQFWASYFTATHAMFGRRVKASCAAQKWRSNMAPTPIVKTAQIFDFQAGGRASLMRQRIDTAKSAIVHEMQALSYCEAGSAWYHATAISDASRVRRS